MVYRIHFTAQDLARTHVAQEPMPLAELDNAARALQDRGQPARFDAWRRRARPRLSTRARMALTLIPPVGWSYGGPTEAGKVEEVLELMRAKSRKEIGEALALLAERQPLPSWARHMADDREVFGRFVDGFSDLYEILMGPYETQLADLFAADRAVRMRQLAAGGIESLLAQASPRWMRWTPPVLEIRMVNGIDYDMLLEGQGVLLAPSMFRTRPIVVAMAGESQPIVIYPVCNDEPLRRLTAFAPERTSMPAIAALLGHTRAAVLSAIAEHPGCSTKELAALAHIAPASASEHATVLRRAGLVSTVRHRNAAVHSPTDLGIALLNRP